VRAGVEGIGGGHRDSGGTPIDYGDAESPSAGHALARPGPDELLTLRDGEQGVDVDRARLST